MPYRIISPLTHRRIGRRGAFLLVLAVVDALLGWSLLAVPPAVYDQLTLLRHIPQVALGVLWIAAAVVAFGYAFARRSDQDFWGFFASYLPPMIFGGIYLLSWWPIGQLSAGTGVRSAVVYWGYMLLVVIAAGWPEPAYKDIHADVTGPDPAPGNDD